MAKLDRILASVDWEKKYPLAQVKMLPKVVSDHNPLKIHFGEGGGGCVEITSLGLKNGGCGRRGSRMWLGKSGIQGHHILTLWRPGSSRLGF
jgi:hypothetical protein